MGFRVLDGNVHLSQLRQRLRSSQAVQSGSDGESHVSHQFPVGSPQVRQGGKSGTPAFHCSVQMSSVKAAANMQSSDLSLCLDIHVLADGLRSAAKRMLPKFSWWIGEMIISSTAGEWRGGGIRFQMSRVRRTSGFSIPATSGTPNC